jgi:hypothetical protein
LPVTVGDHRARSNPRHVALSEASERGFARRSISGVASRRMLICHHPATLAETSMEWAQVRVFACCGD